MTRTTSHIRQPENVIVMTRHLAGTRQSKIRSLKRHSRLLLRQLADRNDRKNNLADNPRDVKGFFVSQYSRGLPKNWRWRACGLAGLKMLLDFWGSCDPRYKKPSLKDLLDVGLKLDAYIKNIGWSHAGLVQVAKAFGFDGYNRDLADKPVGLAFKALEEEVALRPVLVSVFSKFNPTSKDGHLVVVTKVDKNHVWLLDPAEKDAAAGYKSIPKATFLAAYKQRLILIRPLMATKLARLQTGKVDIFSSYMAMIRGSVGTRMFQHLYLRLDGRKQDVMEGGGRSCSSYVSNLLYLWGLISDAHAKTEHTVQDMLASGWTQIKIPREGCVIVWENSAKQRRYAHMGFYVGGKKAISNDSDNTGVPAAHHFTYGTFKGKPKRKIAALYWHRALDTSEH